MKSLKDISVRCSGLMTEATLHPTKKRTLEDVAKMVGVSSRTLREKSASREMYTLPMGVLSQLANLAGYEIEFVKQER